MLHNASCLFMIAAATAVVVVVVSIAISLVNGNFD